LLFVELSPQSGIDKEQLPVSTAKAWQWRWRIRVEQ